MSHYPRAVSAADLALALLAITISPGALAAPEYLCFEGISDKKVTLCYPNTAGSGRDAIVEEAVEKLGLKLDKGETPGTLVTMTADMARFYSRDKFEASLRKNFPLLGSDSVAHMVHHDEHTAVLLKGGSQLLYSHEQQSFIFGFDEPTPLAGLTYYYGRGTKPGTWTGGLPASSCTLSRDGITFVAPARDHRLYSESGSFCEYDGYYFKPVKDQVQVRKVDQIGQRQEIISATGFTAFLEWLRQGQ
ncbi:hypothetical protein [Microbulbifer yueqingensis]|uniref:Uncharacterized protein n=1 Tax=Microbulbifer yueqingensis TaxID=658219 RepID=A0A1G9DR39_9GAMM|nr:hypothetical protein [Microbulbifer yueqingensis]SDK66316.1 hypothetical protein SAMN05216212_2922 [Microbulbifer yueqingensis]